MRGWGVAMDGLVITCLIPILMMDSRLTGGLDLHGIANCNLTIATKLACI